MDDDFPIWFEITVTCMCSLTWVGTDMSEAQDWADNHEHQED